MPALLDREIKFMTQRPKHVAAFPEMLLAEKACIYMFTDILSDPINSLLKTGVNNSPYPTADLNLYATYISAGLTKAVDKFNGTVYRGSARTAEEIEQLFEDMVSGIQITESRFLSSSKNFSTAFDFAIRASHEFGKLPVVYSIVSSSAVDISTISVYTQEEEVLFNNNVSFNIMQIDFEDGVYYVSLTEA